MSKEPMSPAKQAALETHVQTLEQTVEGLSLQLAELEEQHLATLTSNEQLSNENASLREQLRSRPPSLDFEP